jgi:hypothetical protein
VAVHHFVFRRLLSVITVKGVLVCLFVCSGIALLLFDLLTDRTSTSSSSSNNNSNNNIDVTSSGSLVP